MSNLSIESFREWCEDKGRYTHNIDAEEHACRMGYKDGGFWEVILNEGSEMPKTGEQLHTLQVRKRNQWNNIDNNITVHDKTITIDTEDGKRRRIGQHISPI